MVGAPERQINVIHEETTMEEGGTSIHAMSKEKRTRMEREPLISFEGEEANNNT